MLMMSRQLLAAGGGALSSRVFLPQEYFTSGQDVGLKTAHLLTHSTCAGSVVLEPNFSRPAAMVIWRWEFGLDEVRLSVGNRTLGGIGEYGRSLSGMRQQGSPASTIATEQPYLGPHCLPLNEGGA